MAALTFAQLDRKRTYQREWKARRRADWIDANGPCAECGSWDTLEVDHIDPADKHPKLCHPAGTGGVWSWSRKRLAEELAKCQVLCATCHLEKSRADGSLGENNLWRTRSAQPRP